MTDPESKPLNLALLKDLVAGGAVAIRGRAILEPAGGPGDKVFPPTHSVGERETQAGAKYALEKRRLPGGQVEDCVLLDSVQSQANRMEDALQALWADKQITLPVIAVNFASVAPDVGMVTSLSAPHRVADAILRDSLLDGTFFRLSEFGRRFADATPRNAAPLFTVCPTALVFGLWDSTGQKKERGSKFARALVSEIVGVGNELGVKTQSRIDPLGIVTGSGTLYVKKGAPGEALTWTLDPKEAEEAEISSGKEPLRWGSKKGKDGRWKQGDGTPGQANHGNIPPSVEKLAGGVTIDHAEHTVVLSLAGLRKLGFAGDGLEARTVLAALGLLAVLAAETRGHDLRSRCLLVPRKGEALKLEAVAPDGNTHGLTLDLDGAVALFEAAVKSLPEHLRFASKDGKALTAGDPVAVLEPSEKLAHLVRKSRELATTSEDVEES